MASKVTTEFDIDLAKWQAKISQIKADTRAAELAAKQVKLGENLVSANAERELQKIAKLKEQIATMGFEGSLKELGPQQQLYAITQRIAQLKAAAVADGPIRESQALQLEVQTLALNERRVGILKQLTAEKQRAVQAAQAEAQAVGRAAFIEQARGSGRGAGFPGYAPRIAGARGGGIAGIGQAGLQVQDIAVQAQMGTNPIVIASQQIPQLLGSLGPVAALAGAAVAVTGAFALMGYKSKEAFDGIIKGARAAKDELSTLGRVGSLSEIGTGLQKAKEQLDGLIAARSKLYSISGSAGAFFGQLFGGFDKADQLTLLAEQREAAEQRIVRLNDAAIDRSARDLQIQELRAKGKEYEAGQLERIAEKEKALVAIRDSSYDVNTKARLMDHIDTAFAIKEQVAWTAELKRKDQEVNAEREKRLGLIRAEAEQADRLRAQMGERKAERELQGQTPEQQAATLRARAAELQRQGAAFDGEVTEAQKLELQQRINALLERAEDIEKDSAARNDKITAARAEYDLQRQIIEAQANGATADDAKVKALQDQLRVMQLQKQLMEGLGYDAATAAKMAREQVDAENKGVQAAQQRQQNEARISQARQAAITHARAHGHRTEANRLQREADVEARTKEIQDQTGATPEEARKQAEAMQRDIDRANGVRTIRGGRSTRGFEGVDGKSTPGLDAFKANQGKPLRDSFQFPGLDAFRANQPRANGQLAPNLTQQNQQNAANQARAENVMTLSEAPQIVQLLTTIANNLTLAA